MVYNREAALLYAHQWAFARNPNFYNFDLIGGDCTNFISQCLYAGSSIMNFTPTYGWYYISVNDRAPAWTGVEFLYRFLTSNQKVGPYASELPLFNTQPGDVIQLSFDGRTYSHSLIVTGASQSPDPDNILIATHSDDSYNRPLNTYTYQLCRLLHIEGVRR